MTLDNSAEFIETFELQDLIDSLKINDLNKLLSNEYENEQVKLSANHLLTQFFSQSDEQISRMVSELAEEVLRFSADLGIKDLTK